MPGNNNLNEAYLDGNGGKIDEADEKKVMDAACKKFSENFRSKISDHLYFLKKTIYRCPKCGNNFKYMSSFHGAIKLNPGKTSHFFNKKDIKINDLFAHFAQKRKDPDSKMYCKFCNRDQKGIYFINSLYTSPLNFIISFDNSKENEYDFEIEEFIDLSSFIERKDYCKTNYRLIGVIFTEKFEDEHRKCVSYTKDINGYWKYCNGNYISNSDFNEIKNHKNLMVLFYTSI